ncbi:MAG: glucose-6-phosphate dehydrogenase, partial [Thermomicrobiales bacterium]|nr:glucose-6-phosphate dehydrogenase [Thermomicrobiales bacterium]
LLLDVIRGDPTLFTRRDEVESAWAIMQPILDVWSAPDAPFPYPYPAGSWGPVQADEMIASAGFTWRRP